MTAQIFSNPARLPKWAGPERTKDERDRSRGYSIDKKRVAIAYAAEAVIVTASLWGAWLFANMYGHGETIQIEMMMLAPIGYAVIEFCRVPLAISARAHASGFVKTLALIGVICASGVTVKSMSQLGEIMFRPRLFDVVHAQEELQQAQVSLTTITQQIAVADASVTDRRADFGNIEQRARSDAAQLASLPKEQCHQIAGVDRDGKEWKKQACKVDARVPPLIESLKTSAADREAAANRLEQAVAARAKLDKSAAEDAVAAADKHLTETVLHSQLHAFTGMVFGISPTAVTSGQLSQFLRLFVFFPAIFVAFASSFIAFTAVNHIPHTLIPFDPEGTEYLLNPTYQAILNKAIDRVSAKHKADSAAIGETV